MTDEQLKDVLLPIMEGLSESSLFDNDGVLMGYVEKYHVKNHQELLDKKNELIEKGYMNQKGFEMMLFNFEENPEPDPRDAICLWLAHFDDEDFIIEHGLGDEVEPI